jgi:hypothetical protein
MNKFVNLGLIALVGVGLVSAVVLHLWLGTLIKTVVEQVGSTVTRTSVTLKNVDIGLLAGRAQLEGLAVGNPQGFRAPTALKVDTVRARIKWGTVLSDRVVIEEMTIDGPEVTYEGMRSKSNLSTILDNVQSSSTGPHPKPGGPPAQPARWAEKKFLIKDLNLTNGRVAASVGTGMLGKQSFSVPLPDIHLKDIGKESDGATVAEALSVVFGALNKAGAQAVASAAKALEKKAKEAAELVGQDVSKALEAIKGLFKKPK